MQQNTTTKHVETLLNESEALLHAGEVRGATAMLQQIFKTDARNLKARSLFGFCAFHEGDLQTAEENWRWVLERDSQNPLAQRGMQLLVNHRAAVATGSETVASSPGEPPLEPKSLGAEVGEGQKRLSTGEIYQGYVIYCLSGMFLGGVLGAVGVSFLLDIFGVSEKDFMNLLPGGNSLIFLIFLGIIGGIVGIILANRQLKTTNTLHIYSKSTLKPSAKRTPQPNVAQRRDSRIGRFLKAVLWLPLLALGGVIGWYVGGGITGGEGGAILGAIVGVITSQAVQATFTKRSI